MDGVTYSMTYGVVHYFHSTKIHPTFLLKSVILNVVILCLDGINAMLPIIINIHTNLYCYIY